MNILVVTPYYTPNIVGGAEISSQLLAEAMQKMGHGVSVLTLAERDSIDCINGVTVYRYSNSPLIDVWKCVLNGENQSLLMKIKSNYYSMFCHKKMMTNLIGFLQGKKYDIVILNTNEECFCRASLWKAIYDIDIPSILTIRDPLLIEKKLFGVDLSSRYKNTIQKQLSWITAIAAPSQYMLSLYTEAGLSFQNGTVIYNAVDVDYKEPCDKKKRIIYAGSLVEKKGVKTLLKAYELLKTNYGVVDYELCYVGKGNLSEFLSSQDGVTVIPWINREELYQIIHESTVLVLPSEWPEAFGRTVIEAVFNGTLAIGSDAGALPEVFANNKNYLYEEKNALELAQRIFKVIGMNKEEYKNEIECMQNEWDRYTISSFSMNWYSLIKNTIDAHVHRSE